MYDWNFADYSLAVSLSLTYTVCSRIDRFVFYRSASAVAIVASVFSFLKQRVFSVYVCFDVDKCILTSLYRLTRVS